MFATLVASAALLASTAYAGSPGSAVVINGCKYDVQVNAVPAQFGGYDESDHTLSPGQTFTQQWTQLSNGAGWSIKLAKHAGDRSIMQYEYTYQNDGTIWYDLSCVDGNPWDGNWEITAHGDSTCTPKQQAYRYSTDDAYGMQSCNDNVTVTVTLCSGESQNDALVSSLQSAVGSPLSALQAALPTVALPIPAAPTTTSTTTPVAAPAPAPTTSTTAAAVAPAAAETTTQGHGLAYNGGNFYNNKAQVATPTTLTTAISTPAIAAGVPAHGDDTVIVWETVVETAYAYETYVPGKRHVHHPDHPHFR